MGTLFLPVLVYIVHSTVYIVLITSSGTYLVVMLYGWDNSQVPARLSFCVHGLAGRLAKTSSRWLSVVTEIVFHL